MSIYVTCQNFPNFQPWYARCHWILKFQLKSALPGPLPAKGPSDTKFRLSWTQVNVDLQRYLTRREFLGSRPLIFCAERCINLLKILKSCEVSRWRVCGRACAYTCVFHRSKMKTFAHVWKQTTFISFARTPLSWIWTPHWIFRNLSGARTCVTVGNIRHCVTAGIIR